MILWNQSGCIGSSTNKQLSFRHNICRRATGASGGGSRASSDAGRAAAGGSANSFSVRMYADDAPGLKVGPMAVLLTSLVYIGAVVLLHISAKLR